jgi:hypothetical protein
MDPEHSVVLHAQFARRMPAPDDAPMSLRGVETHIFRVRAIDVPAGIPDDANPREPNLDRQVYKRVRDSLAAVENDPGSFHLKHGGIVVVAGRVERLDSTDDYRLWFDPDVQQGIVNGNHSYRLILDALDTDSEGIPSNQYVEIKVYTGVPPEVVPDLAEGLNTAMQVRAESLADLRKQFDWLKGAVGDHPRGMESISWHEGDDGQYEVREVIALLMALDPMRYGVADPVGIENTYARVSSVFQSYLTEPSKVERFETIVLQALELYEYIRYTARDRWPTSRFGVSLLAERKKNSVFTFPFLLSEHGGASKSDTRLIKAAAIPCFSAFRAVVDAPPDGPASWRYPFGEVKALWDECAADLLREVRDAIEQHGRNVHYAGRSVMLYRATTKTLELADLRRRVTA